MKNSILFALLLNYFFAGAQSLTPTVVASSGGFFSNPSGMLSETVGELAAVTTLVSPNNFLTQGFQQTYDFSTGISTTVSAGFSLLVFPNPSEGLFNILIQSERSESLELSVFDILGQKVFFSSARIDSGKNQFRVDLSQKTAGIYMMECLFTNLQNGEQDRRSLKLNLSY